MRKIQNFSYYSLPQWYRPVCGTHQVSFQKVFKISFRSSSSSRYCVFLHTREPSTGNASFGVLAANSIGAAALGVAALDAVGMALLEKRGAEKFEEEEKVRHILNYKQVL